jgi:hypothetical protein
MRRPFNNQWILHRTDPGRGAACLRAGKTGEPDALTPREGLRAQRRGRPRTVRMSDGLHKRPKWIDRDT